VIPIEEFKKMLPSDHNLSEDEIVTMRDLIDIQAENILDSYIVNKALNKNNISTL